MCQKTLTHRNGPGMSYGESGPASSKVLSGFSALGTAIKVAVTVVKCALFTRSSFLYLLPIHHLVHPSHLQSSCCYSCIVA